MKKINFNIFYSFLQNTVVLDGRHYNRGVLIHKRVLEALWRVYWDRFIKWTKFEECDWRLDTLRNYILKLYSELDALHKEFEMDQNQNKLQVLSTLYCQLHFAQNL